MTSSKWIALTLVLLCIALISIINRSSPFFESTQAFREGRLSEMLRSKVLKEPRHDNDEDGNELRTLNVKLLPEPRNDDNSDENEFHTYDAGALPVPSNYKNVRLIIYNRISKCGSTLAKQMMSKMCQVHNILPFRFDSRNKTDFPTALTSIVRHSPLPVLYLYHHTFVDFQRYGLETPPHIQLIRDPVDQAISRYQYERDLGHVKDNEWEKSIAECMKDLSLCPWMDNIINSTILMHFCGAECTFPNVYARSLKCNSIYCLSSNEGAVEVAKRNIVQHHSVVGITEEMDGFFETLAYMHPTYFSGIAQLNKDRRNDTADARVRISKNRKEWPDWAREVILKNRWMDIEVYKFVRQRFYEQWKEAKSVQQLRYARWYGSVNNGNKQRN